MSVEHGEEGVLVVGHGGDIDVGVLHIDAPA